MYLIKVASLNQCQNWVYIQSRIPSLGYFKNVGMHIILNNKTFTD